MWQLSYLQKDDDHQKQRTRNCCLESGEWKIRDKTRPIEAINRRQRTWKNGNWEGHRHVLSHGRKNEKKVIIRTWRSDPNEPSRNKKIIISEKAFIWPSSFGYRYEPTAKVNRGIQEWWGKAGKGNLSIKDSRQERRGRSRGKEEKAPLTKRVDPKKENGRKEARAQRFCLKCNYGIMIEIGGEKGGDED